jgi:hypothetical protein
VLRDVEDLGEGSLMADVVRTKDGSTQANSAVVNNPNEVGTEVKITWRYHGQMYSIGIGRTHAETRVIDATTGELLCELTLDISKRYQGTGRPRGPTR